MIDTKWFVLEQDGLCLPPVVSLDPMPDGIMGMMVTRTDLVVTRTDGTIYRPEGAEAERLRRWYVNRIVGSTPDTERKETP